MCGVTRRPRIEPRRKGFQFNDGDSVLVHDVITDERGNSSMVVTEITVEGSGTRDHPTEDPKIISTLMLVTVGFLDKDEVIGSRELPKVGLYCDVPRL